MKQCSAFNPLSPGWSSVQTSFFIGGAWQPRGLVYWSLLQLGKSLRTMRVEPVVVITNNGSMHLVQGLSILNLGRRYWIEQRDGRNQCGTCATLPWPEIVGKEEPVVGQGILLREEGMMEWLESWRVWKPSQLIFVRKIYKRSKISLTFAPELWAPVIMTDKQSQTTDRVWSHPVKLSATRQMAGTDGQLGISCSTPISLPYLR